MLARGNTQEAARLRHAKSTPLVAARRSYATNLPQDPLASFKTAMTAAACAFDKAKNDVDARKSLDRYLHNTQPRSSPRKSNNSRPHTAQGYHLAQKRSEGRVQARQSQQPVMRKPNLPVENVQYNIERRYLPDAEVQRNVGQSYSERALTRQSGRSSDLAPPSTRTLRKAKSAYTPRTLVSPHTFPLPTRAPDGQYRFYGSTDAWPCSNRVSRAHIQSNERPIHQLSNTGVANTAAETRGRPSLQTLKSFLTLPVKLGTRKSQAEFRSSTQRYEQVIQDRSRADRKPEHQITTSFSEKARTFTSSVRSRVERAFGRTTETGIRSPLRYQQLNANRPHFGSGLLTDPSDLAEADHTNYIGYTYDRLFSPRLQACATGQASAYLQPYNLDLHHVHGSSRVTSWANSSGQATDRRNANSLKSAETTVQTRDFSFPRSGHQFEVLHRLNTTCSSSKASQDLDAKRLHSALIRKIKSTASPILQTSPHDDAEADSRKRHLSRSSSTSEIEITTSADGQESTVKLVSTELQPSQLADIVAHTQWLTKGLANQREVVSPSVYSPVQRAGHRTVTNDTAREPSRGTAVIMTSRPVMRWKVGDQPASVPNTRINTSSQWRAWLTDEVSGIESIEGLGSGADLLDHRIGTKRHREAERMAFDNGNVGARGCNDIASRKSFDGSSRSDQGDFFDSNLPPLQTIGHYPDDLVESYNGALVDHQAGAQHAMDLRQYRTRHYAKNHSAADRPTHTVMNERFPWIPRHQSGSRGPSAGSSTQTTKPVRRIPSRAVVAEAISDFTTRRPSQRHAYATEGSSQGIDLPVLVPRTSSNTSTRTQQKQIPRRPSGPPSTSIQTASNRAASPHDNLENGFFSHEPALDENFLHRIRKGPYLSSLPSPAPSPTKRGIRPPRPSASPRPRLRPSMASLRNVENLPPRASRRMVDAFLESRSSRSFESEGGDGSPAFL